MRLVYEVALREDINQWNVREKVGQYASASGDVAFYTNRFEADGSAGYGKVNTYSYFRPSRENDRYYYQEGSPVYISSGGAYQLYKGASKPTGTAYHQYTIYEKNGSLQTKTVYHELTAENLATAVASDAAPNANTTWSIPAGNIRRDYAGYVHAKETPTGGDNNVTGTLSFHAAPFSDISGHPVNDTTHSFVVGATLGNNGKLTLASETGIRLTKTLAEGTADAGDSFSFTVSGASAGDHPAYKLNADGTVDGSVTSVTFNASGKATVSLKADEVLYIGGMTAGQSVTVTETATEKYILETTNDQVVTIAEGVLAPVNFRNALRGTGNLTITKEVVHPFAEIPQLLAEKFFTVNVTLELEGEPLANRTITAKQTKNGQIQSITTNGEGKFTATLTHADNLELFDLPAGTVATVQETDPGTGFTIGYWENGVREMEDNKGIVTVEDGRTMSVIITNNYGYRDVTVDDIIIRLTAEKNLTGRDWTETDAFQFALQRWTGNGWRTLETQNATKDEKIVDFTSRIRSDRLSSHGSYYYRIVEVEPETPLGGMSYDKAIHAFYVVVDDRDIDGYLEIVDVVSQNTATTSVTGSVTQGFIVATTITNTYSTTAATAGIEVRKSVSNPSLSDLAAAEGFRFKITQTDVSGRPLAATEPVTTPATSLTGTTRATLSFSNDGTYYFRVEEVNDGKANWSYSQAKAYVTVVVSDDGAGHLVATAYNGLNVTTGTGSNTAVIADVFTNTYTPDPVTLTFPADFATKTISGRSLNEGEFVFSLTGTYGTQVTTPTGTVASLTGTNDATGKITFEKPLYYTKVGTYFYDIQEQNNNLGGVGYDPNIFRVVVTVTDNAGRLTASYQVVNVQSNQITFRNTYTAAPVPLQLEGVKKLTGKSLLNGEFAFLMEETDDQYQPKTGGYTERAENAVEPGSTDTGYFLFDGMSYTEAGNYYYTITEEQGGTEGGIVYDSTVYKVRVEVVDDGSGQLKANYYIDGKLNGELIFNNAYTAKPAAKGFAGSKLLNGRLWNNEKDAYSFTLYNSDADHTLGTEIETVNNGTDGSFAFRSLSFTQAGIYHYIIKEAGAGQTIKGVTYDDTVYYVRVEVIDDYRGQLHASVSYATDLAPEVAGIRFVNQYTITGNGQAVIPGTKTLNGRELQDGEFTFQLLDSEGKLLKTAKNQGKDFSFTLDYGPADAGKVFTYTVKEANAGRTIEGVTYSADEYKVTVTVSDNGEGGITTATVITKGDLSVSGADFVNTFTETPPPGVPELGDNAGIYLWSALLLTSGAAMIALVTYGRKKEETAE